MDLAQQCRYNLPPLLYGGVFVDWVQYQPTIGNVDLRVEEVMGGEWVERAAVHNLEYQAGTMGVSDKRQPVVDEMDGTEQEAEGYLWTQTNGINKSVERYPTFCGSIVVGLIVLTALVANDL